jgi:hypothetical protein
VLVILSAALIVLSAELYFQATLRGTGRSAAIGPLHVDIADSSIPGFRLGAAEVTLSVPLAAEQQGSASSGDGPSSSWPQTSALASLGVDRGEVDPYLLLVSPGVPATATVRSQGLGDASLRIDVTPVGRTEGKGGISLGGSQQQKLPFAYVWPWPWLAAAYAGAALGWTLRLLRTGSADEKAGIGRLGLTSFAFDAAFAVATACLFLLLSDASGPFPPGIRGRVAMLLLGFASPYLGPHRVSLFTITASKRP